MTEENKHEKVSNNCIRYRDVPCRNRRSFLWGEVLDEAMGGAILFSMIAGIACVVYAIENRDS